ncbi:response regulator [Chroogloeocystis siderophila]|jgi:chemotaxis family two-component system response regulator PixG|uniref:Protein PatA n=1 Tax=Chroogloeocystis siderophila 5.2 s.c.1 TaxID=247279 RepID=A0A1U7HYX3_9CHRO|nr:response regulator [Chroogloeocystis siderophila]OKH28831.1 response regulator [Chroogloeocystis siderophila 5.2 s.c.1]
MLAETINNTDFVSKLAILKQERFSGKLILKDIQGQEWNIYLFLGRILYATGGNHPVKRWRRNLLTYCPQIDVNALKFPENTDNSSGEISWEYLLLYSAVEQQQTTRDQAAKIITSIVAEVLFDITQATNITGKVKPDNLSVPQLVLLEPGQAIAEAQNAWQNWQKAKLADRSPNRAPIIREPEQLQQQVSPAVFQNLTKLLDGQRSLRDIAAGMKRDVMEVTSSLLPYIQSGLIEFVDIPDAAPPISPPATVASQPTIASSKALIACVDDSPLVCQSLEKILTTAGYQFISIQDSLRAIATLLTRKPELIFLDLVMPNTNGYEICSQLRKVSVFRDTPIIILTGNDGIIDRVRAKLVGATDFLSKPVDAQTLLEVTQTHLNKTPQV